MSSPNKNKRKVPKYINHKTRQRDGDGDGAQKERKRKGMVLKLANKLAIGRN